MAENYDSPGTSEAPKGATGTTDAEDAIQSVVGMAAVLHVAMTIRLDVARAVEELACHGERQQGESPEAEASEEKPPGKSMSECEVHSGKTNKGMRGRSMKVGSASLMNSTSTARSWHM